jgi:hypothetical protein
MRSSIILALVMSFQPTASRAGEPNFIAKPDAFKTLVNPACSHCVDEAKRRAKELKADDRVLCWLRGYSDGGAIPIRFFLAPYRVISDSYGVFVYDPDAGYARGFAPSYEFRFHGWRNGVMVMKHKDGTLFSCLTGVAFDGPRKGSRLAAIPTLVSAWGFWLEKYPQAVAYHMFDKYQPTQLSGQANLDAVKSRGRADSRLKEEEVVFGVRTGKAVQAYPLRVLEKEGILQDTLAGKPLVVLWEPRTRTAAAYHPVASPPRKFRAPQPGPDGVSPPDERTADATASRPLTIGLAPKAGSGRFQDKETKSAWDVAGRCLGGELKGWTLEWVDSVQVKWFAWSAEYPHTEIFGPVPLKPHLAP